MYLNNWTSQEQMENDFQLKANALKKATVLLASYGTQNHKGNAFVLFEREGKLFEVNGSHCSCFGLEDQWEPEETSAKALLKRLDKGTFGSVKEEGLFAAELRTLLLLIDRLR